jgi:hypothetical protein
LLKASQVPPAILLPRPDHASTSDFDAVRRHRANDILDRIGRDGVEACGRLVEKEDGDRRAEDILASFEAISARADALLVLTDALTTSNRVRINTVALAARLPTMQRRREFISLVGNAADWPLAARTTAAPDVNGPFGYDRKTDA